MSYNQITTQHLVNAWVDVVVDEIKDYERMHDMCRDEGDGTWGIRSHTPLWGSYWTIRKITGSLLYNESRHVEEAMDRFLNQYCETIKQTKIVSEESA